MRVTRRRITQRAITFLQEAQPRRRRRGDGDDDEEDGGTNAEQYDYKPGEQEDEEIDEDGAFDSEDERR